MAKEKRLEVSYRDASDGVVTVYPDDWEFVKDAGGIIKLHWNAAHIPRMTPSDYPPRDVWVGPSALVSIEVK